MGTGSWLPHHGSISVCSSRDSSGIQQPRETELLDRKRAVVREQRREEERCSVNISHVTDTVHGTAHPCVGKRMQPSPTPTGKGGKCCTVHGLTRRIHNVQPNLQSPILSAACVD
nr:PREDICTED: LOW QUALITY PROTEIN: putative uncharacterized protein C9orf92 homolog [Equus przewalskii]